MITKANVMITVPSTIQIRRRPHLEVVRSDRRPNTTFATVANSAPTPPRIAAAPIAPSSGSAPASTRLVIFSPIPTIAGPSRATKNTNWAMRSHAT
jgi:hypothetical protein